MPERREPSGSSDTKTLVTADFSVPNEWSERIEHNASGYAQSRTR